MPIYKNKKTGVIVDTIAPVIGIDWVEMPTQKETKIIEEIKEVKEPKKETPKKTKAKKEK